MPEDQTRDKLLEFLKTADKVAMKRGAKNEGRDSALTLGSEEYFFQTVQVISKSKGKVVVRVKSLYNSLIGEPVLIYFELKENQRVYKKGEVIASREIDADQLSNAESELLTLLSDVSAETIRRGMVTDQDGSVGKIIGGEEFLKALSQIKEAKGKVRVVARAADDIWTADGPPSVTLTVEKVSNSNGKQVTP